MIPMISTIVRFSLEFSIELMVWILLALFYVGFRFLRFLRLMLIDPLIL